MVFDDVIGVVEVGGVRGLNVPQAAYRTLALRVGETTTVKMRIVRSNGVWQNLAGGAVLLMVKDRPGSFGDKKFEKTATILTSEGEGWCSFSITPLDTKRLEEENKLRYFWEVVFIDSASNRYYVVPTSPLRLLSSLNLP